MKWFGKKETKEVVPENETGVHAATLNWFIHALIENVGHNKWVRMTKEEQAIYDAECPYNAGYPYKVVTSPIPKGKDIVLKDSGTTTIKCDSEKTRNMIIEMAREYDMLERHNRFLRANERAEIWHPVSDLKPIPMFSSIRGPRTFIVSSPELCYVNGGIAIGREDEGKWFVFLNGKKVEHTPTHYRHLPPHPEFELDYESVKLEVEHLRKALDES